MGQMKRYSQFLKELPSKTVVLAFGRFNPPTIGHELLIKAVKKVAKTHNADHSIYASKTTDTKKNPLTVDKKVKYLKLMFPGTNFVAANDQERTFLEAAKHLNKKYKNLIMVAGSDRVQEFTRLLNTYNGKEFKYDTVEVVSAGERDPDADDASGMSASKMRALASKGDYAEFKKGLPSSIRDIDGRRLMNDVRQGMGLDMVKEDIILVKDTLREQYFLGDIFNIGDIVESSGVKYEIVKRGSNHLLLKEESGKLVSKWIQDVSVVEDVQPGYAPKEISFDGYTTKNFHHHEDAVKAFQDTISRFGSTHKEIVKTALTATDKYMQLNDMHITSGEAPTGDEIKQWIESHGVAKQALDNIGEFLHHEDYWHQHRHELETMLNQYKDKGAESVAEETMKTEPKSYKDFVSDLRTDIEDPFTNTPIQDQPETGLVGHSLHSEPLDTYMRHRKVKYQLGEAMHPAFGTPNFDRAQKKGPEANPFRKQKTAADIQKIKKAKEADAKITAKAKGGIYKKQTGAQRKQTVKGYMDLLKQIGESSSKLSSQRETSTPVYDAHIKGNSDYSSIVKKHGSHKTREIIHGLSKERDSLRKHSGEWAGPAHVRNHDFAIRGLKKAIGEEVEDIDIDNILQTLEEAISTIDKGEYDYEGAMARTQLQTVVRNSQELISMLSMDDNMPEWVQSKITLAQDYISSVRDYLKSREELGEEVELDESHVEFRIDHREKSTGDHKSTFASHDAKVSDSSDKATYVKVPKEKADSFKTTMKTKHGVRVEIAEEATPYYKKSSFIKRMSQAAKQERLRREKQEKEKKEVKEEASPMVKPPSNRFDDKKSAFAHAKEHGGKVYKREYVNPRTGTKQTHFVVKEGYDELQSADYKTDAKGKKYAARHIVFKNGEEESDEEKAKHQREQIELEEKKRIKETPVKDDSAQLGDEEDKGYDAFFEEEEFDIEDMSDDELDKMAGEIEDEDDIMDEYEDDEFSIVDDETGEELPEDEDEKEIKEAALYEVLSRMERMRAKARMRRTKAKRERATKIALKRYSSNPTINKRSRRLAIKLMKKRLLRGRDPSKISVGEKERIERVIEKRKKIIGRLAMRLAPRVRKIEKARLSHTKFTQGAPNVAF
jgi:nicotinic acid mononucleotide adenylyltransferase